MLIRKILILHKSINQPNHSLMTYVKLYKWHTHTDVEVIEDGHWVYFVLRITTSQDRKNWEQMSLTPCFATAELLSATKSVFFHSRFKFPRWQQFHHLPQEMSLSSNTASKMSLRMSLNVSIIFIPLLLVIPYWAILNTVISLSSVFISFKYSQAIIISPCIYP